MGPSSRVSMELVWLMVVVLRVQSVRELAISIRLHCEKRKNGRGVPKTQLGDSTRGG